jgi:F5/8 type C domain/PASTA domain
MAKSFAITTTSDTLKADARGHAAAVFTITNVTARPVRSIALAVALDNTKRDWLSIEGESERDFGAGTTQQFTVNFDAVGPPPASGPAGKYPFRLTVASAMNPDEDFTEGPTVTVEVGPTQTEVKPPPSRPLWWIIPVAAVVLIGILVGAWLLLRTRKVEVPSVVGKTVAEATSTLSEAKLKANVKETRVTGTVSEGRVAEQSPTAGSGRIAEDSTVDLVVEAARPVPSPVSTPVPTQRINVAVGKKTSQSSTYPGGLPSKAVDGNTNGNWAENSVTHTNSEANAWWQVDLGAVHSIVQIKIWNRTDCCPERLSNFFVLVSNAPFTSNDLNSTLSQPGVAAFPAPSQAGVPTTITVGKPGRYVRVQLVGANYLSLAEVEVMADVPNVAWSRPAGKHTLARSFGAWMLQYVQQPGAVPGNVPKQRKHDPFECAHGSDRVTAPVSSVRGSVSGP